MHYFTRQVWPINDIQTISQYVDKNANSLPQTICVKMRYFYVRHRKIARFSEVPYDARPQLHAATFTAPEYRLWLIYIQVLVQACEAQNHILQNIITFQNNGSVLVEVEFACCEHTSSLNSLLVCFDDAVSMGKTHLAYLLLRCNFILGHRLLCVMMGGSHLVVKLFTAY